LEVCFLETELKMQKSRKRNVNEARRHAGEGCKGEMEREGGRKERERGREREGLIHSHTLAHITFETNRGLGEQMLHLLQTLSQVLLLTSLLVLSELVPLPRRSLQKSKAISVKEVMQVCGKHVNC
jgi:hypothetical protein